MVSDATRIRVAWGPVPGASGFRISWRTGSGQCGVCGSLRGELRGQPETGSSFISDPRSRVQSDTDPRLDHHRHPGAAAWNPLSRGCVSTSRERGGPPCGHRGSNWSEPDPVSWFFAYSAPSGCYSPFYHLHARRFHPKGVVPSAPPCSSSAPTAFHFIPATHPSEPATSSSSSTFLLPLPPPSSPPPSLLSPPFPPPPSSSFSSSFARPSSFLNFYFVLCLMPLLSPNASIDSSLSHLVFQIAAACQLSLPRVTFVRTFTAVFVRSLPP